MAEANDGIKYWISMIKDHVDFDGIGSQEVHNFYSGLDNNGKESFTKFMRKQQNRTITGIEVQKADGGGTNKYLKIDMNVFKSCLKIFNININQMDIDIDDNNNDNNDNNDDNNNIEQPTKKARTEYTQKYVKKIYLQDMKQGVDSMKEGLDGLFANYDDNPLLKSYLIDYALKMLMKTFKGCSGYNIYEGRKQENDVIDGLRTYFADVKKHYPGTIDSKVNIVKKSVTSVIKNYSGLGDSKLRKIFPDVKWSFSGTGFADINEVADELAGDIAQADDEQAREEVASDSESDSDSSESDSDESDCVKILKSIATDVFKERTTRKDHVDLDVPNRWLHDMSPLDTNTHGNYCVITKSGEEVVAEYHQRRTQVYDTNTLLEMFHQSQEYLDFQNRTGQTIGLSLLKRSKCPCIKNDHMRSCVDVLKSGMSYAIKAINKVLESSDQSCTCRFCSNNRQESKAIFKSEKTLLDWLLCKEIKHVTVNRGSVDNSQRGSIQKENIESAKRKYKDTKNYCSYVPDKTKVPTYQQEVYTNHQYKCSHYKCNQCGLGKLKELDVCKLLNSDILKGNIKEYTKDVHIAGDDREKETGKDKSLKKVKKTFKDILSSLKAQLVKYIPHVWQTRNDDFMRKLLLENGFDRSTVIFHTDFSAVLALLSQNSECCHHPSNSIQDVFVVSYLNDDDEIVNDAYHFWGQPQKEPRQKLKSNTAYHSACLKHIIRLLKATIFANRDLKKIYVLTDGCAAQYKNISNIFAMTDYCDEFDLDFLIHTYAPTSNFKCCCDACGADTKRWYRKEEMRESERCSSALQCYLLLANKMPQPSQSRSQLRMRLWSRSHFFVCTPDDEEATRKALEEDYKDTGVDKRNNYIIVNDAEFYDKARTKTLDGIMRFHQLIFQKKGSNKHAVQVRLATCSCTSCLAMDFQNCFLKQDIGRLFYKRQLVDQDMSYILDFFGKYEKEDDEGKKKLAILGKNEWLKLKGQSTVIVGLDLGDGDVQLGIMQSRPEKADSDEEFSIGTYATALLKGSYYFPVKLLVKLDLSQSRGVPNCYLPIDTIQKVPLHCIIPPYVEEGQVRSFRNGRESMSFTNYISCRHQEVEGARGGKMNCVIVENSQIRFLKNNMLHSI